MRRFTSRVASRGMRAAVSQRVYSSVGAGVDARADIAYPTHVKIVEVGPRDGLQVHGVLVVTLVQGIDADFAVAVSAE